MKEIENERILDIQIQFANRIDEICGDDNSQKEIIEFLEEYREEITNLTLTKDQLELQEHWAELEGVDVDEVKKYARNLVDYIIGLEQARWQHRIDKIIRKDHDTEVDASGEDSGDPLDFTGAEIGQAICCAERGVKSVNDPEYFNRS